MTLTHRTTDAFVALALVIVTVIPYVQTGWFDFVNFDDPAYVFENPLLQDGLTPPRIHESIFGFHQANWHPLVWLSYMLEIELWGMKSGSMHLTNVALHSLNSLFVFLWLRRATNDIVRSALAALLFALHPMHVESVAWITERKDVLSTLFLLATLAAYTEYSRHQGRAWYAAALLAFALGLTAKGMLVTVPVVLLLLDIWPLQRMNWQDVTGLKLKTMRTLFVEKIPFFALSAVISVVTVMAQRSGGAVAELHHHSMGLRIANTVVSYARYCLKTLWPSRLSVFYPMPSDGWSAEILVPSVLIFCLITTATVALRKKRPALLVGWAWFVITLLPVIGLIQVGSQSLADRYMYIPMMGLSILVFWSIPDRCFRPTVVNVASMTIPAMILLLLTSYQVSVWKNSISLYEHSLAAVPDNNFVAHNNLGIAYSDAGRFREAADQLERALRIQPNDTDCLTNIARNHNRAGNFAQAEAVLNEAVRIDDNDAVLWLHFGNTMRGLHRPDTAAEYYKLAVTINPRFSEALNNLGMLLCRTNNAMGMQYIKRAIEADPTNPQAHNSLGNALARDGHLRAAERSYIQALQLGHLPEAERNLHYIRELLGK